MKFSLSYKFEVAKFGQYGFGYFYSSPDIQLTYNNVSLYWALQIYPNGGKQRSADTEYPSRCGLFARYVSGPKESILVSSELNVLDSGNRLVCTSKGRNNYDTETPAWGWFSELIPNKYEELVEKNLLTDNNSMLHVQVELDIPSGAFDDSNNQYSARAQPAYIPTPDVNVDFYRDFFREEFSTINCEVNEDDNRFEIISQDRRHFWVHKYIMIYRSPVFKAIFKSDAGDEGCMNECQKKCISIEGVSGAALKQILHYMYMGYMNELTDDMINQVLLFASVHFLDGLKIICENKLLKQYQRANITVEEIIELSMESEKFGLKRLKENCMSFWAKNWTDAKDKGNSCVMSNVFYCDEIGQAFLKDLFVYIDKKLSNL